MSKKIILLLTVLLILYVFPSPVEAICKTSPKKGTGGEANNDLLNQLGVSWWYNWQWWDQRNFTTHAEFIPLVNAGYPFYDRTQDRVIGQDIIRVGVNQRRGGYWLVGNEPDRAGQDAIFDPIATARIYKKLADAIKSEDSTAKIIVGGWAQPEGNNNYATSLKNNWPNFCSEIAGWHFHHYANSSQYNNLPSWLNETNQFINHLNSLCSGKEIWVTEIGNFQETNEQNLINWMNILIPALESANNIHRYAWYEIKDKPAQHPNMPGLIRNGSLTNLGLTYQGLGSQPCVTPTPTPLPGTTLEAENFEIIQTDKRNTYVVFKKNTNAPNNRGYIQTSFEVDKNGEYSFTPRVNYPSSTRINSLYYRIVKGEAENIQYGVDTVFGNGNVWDTWFWEDAEHRINYIGLKKNQKYQIHISFRDEGSSETVGPKLDKIQIERQGNFQTKKINFWAKLLDNYQRKTSFSFTINAATNRYYLAADRFTTIQASLINFPKCTNTLQEQCTFDGKAVFFRRGSFIQTSFIFPESGDFYIWLRPRHTPGWANSFYLTLNQGGPENANLIAPRMIDNSGFYNKWQWTEGNIFMVNLKANKLYTLTIYFREEGTENGPYLDLICFSPTKDFPPNTLPTSILPNVEITPTPSVCPDSNKGNLNCDSQGLINELDLAILLDKWSPQGPVPPPSSGQASADLNNDGKVDEKDFSMLISNWKN